VKIIGCKQKKNNATTMIIAEQNTQLKCGLSGCAAFYLQWNENVSFLTQYFFVWKLAFIRDIL